MKYRTLGRTGFEVSEIGLGTEYLIDRTKEHVASVIHGAIDNGINYFDLFFAQPEFRDNMGAAFAGHRDGVFLAAHLGAAHIEGQYQAIRDVNKSRRFVEDFLRRYHTDYVDVLVLHNSDGRDDYEQIMSPGGLKDIALELKNAGVARSIGFSGHTAETSLLAVQSGIVDVLMFPISIAGNAVEGKSDLLSACVEQNVGVVAMKVFGGGKLLSTWDSGNFSRWQLGGQERTLEHEAPLTAVRGIHYALSQPGVCTVVPGCKDIHELGQALRYTDAGAAERDYSEVLLSIRQFESGECVYCNHCLPCPSSIDIGKTIRLYEIGRARSADTVVNEYRAMDASAGDCVECGDCESRCPFGVEVIPKMREAADVFGG
jgi:predicted aldo/keto reductase-like oxidoreductase